jgi:hypothetical protein
MIREVINSAPPKVRFSLSRVAADAFYNVRWVPAVSLALAAVQFATRLDSRWPVTPVRSPMASPVALFSQSNKINNEIFGELTTYTNMSSVGASPADSLTSLLISIS